MKAIIVGGGKVGFYLLKTLVEKKYNVTLIERDMSLCERIADDVDADIINGDGTDIEVLKDAGADRADIVAAVTGKDEENFVICKIAKVTFKIKETIARINNPKNRAVFKSLGIDKTVCSTQVISNLIQSEFDNKVLRVVQTIDMGELAVLETTINKNSMWCNKNISVIDIPSGCIIVSIFRNERIIAPNGDIQIKNSDRLLIVTNINNMRALEKSLTGE